MSPSRREKFSNAQNALLERVAKAEDIKVLNKLTNEFKSLDKELSDNLKLEANLTYLYLNPKPLEVWKKLNKRDRVKLKNKKKKIKKFDHQPKTNKTWFYIVAAAALITLALVLPQLLIQFSNEDIEKEPTLTQTQPEQIIKGEDKFLNLDDGSQLKLTGEIKAPNSQTDAWVLLDNSDLSCDITKKAPDQKPFKVNTSRGLITVMGTKFNLSSHDQLHWVDLFSGSIRIEDAKGIVDLSPGESAVLSEEPWELYLIAGGDSFRPIKKIINHETIETNQFSATGLNIRIETPREVTHINSKLLRDGIEVEVMKNGKVFEYDSLENRRPFHLFGEKRRVIHGAIPPEGELTLEVEAHYKNGQVKVMNWKLNFKH